MALETQVGVTGSGIVRNVAQASIGTGEITANIAGVARGLGGYRRRRD